MGKFLFGAALPILVGFRSLFEKHGIMFTNEMELPLLEDDRYSLKVLQIIVPKQVSV